MQLTYTSKSKIYIIAPANTATGGVELLFQLAYKIEHILGHKNIYLFFWGRIGNKDPIPNDYKHYNINYVENIEDNPENILIVPEIYTKELSKYKNIKKVLWRLSVDNYYHSIKFLGFVNRQILLNLNLQKYFGRNNNLKKIKHHRVQCEYAKQHLIKKGIPKENIHYLSDFLNQKFFLNNYNISDKKNIIAYNPKKGFKFTEKIIKYMKNDDVKFIPIKNMSRQQVIDLLKTSKIYIDFGYFPGKDRIPREATIMGCLILISKMGAGQYYEDFPLGEDFKIKDLKNKELIRGKILNLCEKYENIIKDKEIINYNNIIKNEEKKFEEDLKKCLTKLNE